MSLVGSQGDGDKSKLYDMYTAISHTYEYSITIGYPNPVDRRIYESKKRIKERRTAVGITTGSVVVDVQGKYASEHSTDSKAAREKFFPNKLLDLGVGFRCQEGQASVEQDKDKILNEISEDTSFLDNAVHGVVAASAINRVLTEPRGKRAENFIQSIKRGCRDFTIKMPKCLHKDFGSESDVLKLLLSGTNAFRNLSISTTCKTLPPALWQLGALTSLELNVPTLSTLPSSIAKLGSLTHLALKECNNLESLPEISGMSSLTHLTLQECNKLEFLPDGSKRLSCIVLEGCHQLQVPSELEAKVQQCQKFVLGKVYKVAGHGRTGIYRFKVIGRTRTHLDIRRVGENGEEMGGEDCRYNGIEIDTKSRVEAVLTPIDRLRLYA